MERNVYNVIIIGAGLAGLNTAYHLSKEKRVALFSSATLEDSNSYFAQGGMAAVTSSSDSPREHYEDTMVAGAGLCDPEAVRVLTEEAPKAVEELEQLGMQFDSVDGHLALGLEGGHHHHRILHAGGDATGRQISRFMISKVKGEPGITLFEHHTLIALIVEEQRCYGAWIWDAEAKQLEAYYAHSVVLATGGAAALYRPTTNPPTALGDGLSIAYQAGAVVRDMEFIQFHPTALHLKGAPSYLISEAVRGEGAYLLNPDGERFMVGRHPLAELAPRDVVAREIYSEMQKYDVDSITLSLRHLDPQKIYQRFPTISKELQKYGLDLATEIPIAPAAHYTVGGVRVDLNGHTSIDGLYAVGEVSSTGLMGANRLASNSLVECLVYSTRIARHIEKLADSPMVYPTTIQPPVQLREGFDDEVWMAEKGRKMMKRLGKILMKRAGIVRSSKRLQKGLAEVTERLSELEDLAKESIAVREVYNHHLVAQLIMLSAEFREESRGGHYRKDFPETLPPEATYHTETQENKITLSLIHI